MSDRDTIDRILTTTRSVRKRLDLHRPVAPEIVQECLEIAIQAPISSNEPTYHFVAVTDPARRAAVAGYYRKAFYDYAARAGSRRATFAEQAPRVLDSARHLADRLHEVPVLVIPCVEGRVDGGDGAAGVLGTILPAAWSFMLALRARGLGAAWTTLHLPYEREVGRILGVPADVTQACLLPVAYYTGEDFRPARRVPARERTYWNAWGETR